MKKETNSPPRGSKMAVGNGNEDKAEGGMDDRRIERNATPEVSASDR